VIRAKERRKRTNRKRYTYREISYGPSSAGSCFRRVKRKDLKATFVNGVLEVSIRSRRSRKQRRSDQDRGTQEARRWIEREESSVIEQDERLAIKAGRLPSRSAESQAGRMLFLFLL